MGTSLFSGLKYRNVPAFSACRSWGNEMPAATAWRLPSSTGDRRNRASSSEARPRLLANQECPHFSPPGLEDEVHRRLHGAAEMAEAGSHDHRAHARFASLGTQRQAHFL